VHRVGWHLSTSRQVRRLTFLTIVSNNGPDRISFSNVFSTTNDFTGLRFPPWPARSALPQDSGVVTERPSAGAWPAAGELEESTGGSIDAS
jgi:hypothetical protein